MIEWAERWCFVAIWALILPLVRYSFFVILTAGMAAIGLLLGLKHLVITIYLTGFVPTLVTAIVFEFLLRRLSLPLSEVGVSVVAAASAFAWWSRAGLGDFGNDYASFAILASACLSASLMPLISREWEAREARLQSAKSQ